MNEPFFGILELMGHVRIAGRITEEERFGAKLGRIDIPCPVQVCQPCNGKVDHNVECSFCAGKGAVGGGFTTQYFGGGSIYRLTPTTEAIARAVAAKSQPQPVSPWELPRLPAPPESTHASIFNEEESDYETLEDDDGDQGDDR